MTRSTKRNTRKPKVRRAALDVARGSVRHVRQRDRSGCGIACVAMLTGLDYQTVRSAWVGYSTRREFQLIAGGNGAGMTAGEINALLWRLGGANVRAQIDCVPTLYRGIPFGGHWVVRTKRHTFDPASSPNKTAQPRAGD